MFFSEQPAHSVRNGYYLASGRKQMRKAHYNCGSQLDIETKTYIKTSEKPQTSHKIKQDLNLEIQFVKIQNSASNSRTMGNRSDQKATLSPKSSLTQTKRKTSTSPEVSRDLETEKLKNILMTSPNSPNYTKPTNQSSSSDEKMDLTTSTQVATKQKLPPPIIVPAAAKLMTTAPAETINVKAFKDNSVKIQYIESDMFIVHKYLTITEINFHTFPSPKERTLKVIIKGLTTDITEEELTKELKNKGYDSSYTRKFV